MTFKLSNFRQATPKKWQMIGTLALVLIPVLIGIVDNMPNVSEAVQTTIMFWMSSALSVLKVLTEFFGEGEE